MQITMGAKCWDGVRRKSLTERVHILELQAEYENPAKFDPRLKALISFAVPIMFIAGGLPPFGITRAFAAAAPQAIPTLALSAGVKEKILHAFDPLIDLVQLLAYPVAGVMIAGGCLFIMVGNRDTGMKMLQNAAIGYILVQLSPLFLDLLVGIGSAAV